MAAADASIQFANSCELSLNKKTAIPNASPATTLAQLGLAHGDLVYLLDRSTIATAAVVVPPPVPTPAAAAATERRQSPVKEASAPPAGRAAAAVTPTAETQLVAMGFGIVEVRRALAQASGRIDRAAEMLTGRGVEPMAVEHDMLPSPAQHTTPQPFTPAAATEADAPSTGSSSWASISPAEARRSPESATDTMRDAQAHSLLTASRPLPPSTLVPQTLVNTLSALLSSSAVDSPHERLVLAIHAVVAQSGFTPTQPETTTTTSIALAAGLRVTAPLPVSWRATAPALYTLRYGHSRHGSLSAAADGAVLELKAVPMGETLLVHAMPLLASRSGSPPPALLHCQAATSEHGLTRVGAAGSPTLLKLPRLVHRISTALVQPMLATLATAAVAAAGGVGVAGGGHRRTELADLCPELKFAVLTHVIEPGSLTRLSGTCSELRCLALDDLLWARLYEARFGDGPPGTDDEVSSAAAAQAAMPASAAAAYRRRVERERREAREKESRRQAAREAGRRDYGAPFPYGGMPAPPGGFGGGLGAIPAGGMPGMLGGDFDRMPGAGLPPPYGPNPFAGMGGGMGGGMDGGGLPFGGGGPMIPGGPGDGFLPHGAVPPGARYDPISPLIDPDGMSGRGGGGVGGVPFGRGRGRGRAGGGRGGSMPGFPGMPPFGGGRGGDGWDPAGGML